MKYLRLLSILLLTSCGQPFGGPQPQQAGWAKSSNGAIVEAVNVDGCVYITYSNVYAGGICHSGNCPNPTHQNDTTK